LLVGIRQDNQAFSNIADPMTQFVDAHPIGIFSHFVQFRVFTLFVGEKAWDLRIIPSVVLKQK